MVKKKRGYSIRSVAVEGFKSIRNKQTIGIRPLTLLAGANSSGKSSFLQPLLLLKQTLDAPYDPGALLLDGTNVRFTDVGQLLWKPRVARNGASHFSVGLDVTTERAEVTFAKGTKGAEVVRTNYRVVDHKGKEQEVSLWPGMSKTDFDDQNPSLSYVPEYEKIAFREVKRMKCLLQTVLTRTIGSFILEETWPYTMDVVRFLTEIVHLPGLRGNPRRTYQYSAAGPQFPGVFNDYVAGVISSWKSTDKEKLERLGNDLRHLGLTWKAEATAIDDTQVELKVGRLRTPARGGARDLVSIADVGFGVSQTLPVLVSLLVANPGQMVYLEQPEIHLHPNAQLAMADLLSAAAKRGVVVVAETHSQFLLWGIQRLVAEGKLDPNLVQLHWFSRDSDGATEVTSRGICDNGDFGDWPEDFSDAALTAQDGLLRAMVRSEKKSR